MVARPRVKEEEEALELIKMAWDAGINFIDTADVYSNGESERIIAKAIKKFNIPRDRLVIATKCFMPVFDDSSVGVGTANDRDQSKALLLPQFFRIK